MEQFVNTLDVEAGIDALDATDGLREWLSDHDLLDVRQPATDEDLAVARALRDGLRRALEAHHAPPGGASDIPELEAVSRELPLRVTFGPDAEPALAPARAGVPGALASVLAGAVTAAVDGTWERLKICPADDCQWAFYDRSKNRSRRWCAMRVCGNREKTRSYRERRSTA